MDNTRTTTTGRLLERAPTTGVMMRLPNRRIGMMMFVAPWLLLVLILLDDKNLKAAQGLSTLSTKHQHGGFRGTITLRRQPLCPFYPHRSTTTAGALTSSTTSTSRHAYYYGRGAEIWPPPIDGDKPLDLADSFPHRKVPPEAATAALKEEDSTTSIVELTPRTWTRTSLMSSLTRRILRRAAAQDEQAVASSAAPPDDGAPPQLQSTVLRFLHNVPKVPGLLALGLVAVGAVSAADVLGVAVVSLYFVVLGLLSQRTREDGVTPLCPGLPPQGHVPLLVRIPLSPATVQSRKFVIWCRMAALFGLIQPIVAATYHHFTGSTSAVDVVSQGAAASSPTRLLLRPVFWACCQLISERAGRKTFPAAPLPIRILVPILHIAIRLPMLWECATSSYWGPVGRTFAVLNLAFWSYNLFGFLLPVATMRYLRAHFFMVEAEQVTLRPGMEKTIGLPP